MRTPQGQSDRSRVGTEQGDGRVPLENLASAQESLERASARLARLVQRDATRAWERDRP